MSRAAEYAAAPGGSVIDVAPLRRPESGNPRLMARRGWWLVALNFLFPGTAQAAAGNRRLARFGLGATLFMWAMIVLLVVGALAARTVLLGVLAHAWVLYVLGLLVAAYTVLWVVLSLDTLRLVRVVRVPAPQRFFVLVLCIALTVLQVMAGVFAARSVFTVSSAFSQNLSSNSITVPPSDGYYNIALLGADSGDGRDSLRYDSISIVSINAETGAMTITGIPRDLEHVPFSADSPMLALYPNYFEGHGDPECGWNSGINQLTNAVSFCREDRGDSLYPDARDQDSLPEIEATKDAASGLLGIEVQYYISIDMHGFGALIDAVGGVDITVDERLPEGGGPAYDGQPAEEWATGWIEPGAQHMNGETALWYARSRYTTSDWDRMERQRELQTALLNQLKPNVLLTKLGAIKDAGTAVVETDIPDDLASTFLDLAVKSREHETQTIELNPDNGVDQEWPDVDMIHQKIDAALHPAEASE